MLDNMLLTVTIICRKTILNASVMLEGANGLSAAGCCSLLHAAVRDVQNVLVCKDQGDSADIALL